LELAGGRVACGLFHSIYSMNSKRNVLTYEMFPSQDTLTVLPDITTGEK
jgi:hypothetical protein